jgi:hypothetical protein
MSEPIRILIDAETARDQERRHLDKAAYYDGLAARERQKAEKFHQWAEQADAGTPVVLSDKR